MQEEFGELQGLSLVYVGDGNNVAAALAVASAMVGITLTIAAPAGYQLDQDLLDAIHERYPAAELHQVGDAGWLAPHRQQDGGGGEAGVVGGDAPPAVPGDRHVAGRAGLVQGCISNILYLWRRLYTNRYQRKQTAGKINQDTAFAH